MKTLILTSSTGEGHNSCAKALLEIFSIQGEAEIVDALSFKNKGVSEKVAGTYNNMIKKMPKVFGMIYGAGNVYSKTRIPSPIYYLNSKYANELFEFIKKNEYDTILCPHLFPMQAMTFIKKNFPLKAKCYGVMTDYTCIPFLRETDLDGLFLPSKETALECEKQGMRRDKLFVTGIPVLEKFRTPLSKERARSELGMSPNDKIMLIMTGGVGCGNITKLCDKIFELSQRDDLKVYVLVGRNDSLKASLTQYFDKSPLVPVAFTNKVELYLKSADVVVTKPGGLSTTEAAVSNVPLVHTMAIPGCESKNAKYFEQKGMSFHGTNPKKTALLALHLLENQELCEKLLTRQRETFSKNASEEILKIVMSKHLLNDVSLKACLKGVELLQNKQ